MYIQRVLEYIRFGSQMQRSRSSLASLWWCEEHSARSYRYRGLLSYNLRDPKVKLTSVIGFATFNTDNAVWQSDHERRCRHTPLNARGNSLGPSSDMHVKTSASRTESPQSDVRVQAARYEGGTSSWESAPCGPLGKASIQDPHRRLPLMRPAFILASFATFGPRCT